ncbi:hypothetical protein D3C71_1967480 [compost metagenome]
MLPTMAGNCEPCSSAGLSTATAPSSQGSRSQGGGTKRCMPRFCTIWHNFGSTDGGWQAGGLGQNGGSFAAPPA